MKKSIFLLLVFLFLCGLSYSSATADVKGKVSDDAGKPLANVRVEAINTPIITMTETDGSFALEELASGEYQILFTHPDYRTDMIKIDVNEKPEKLIHVTLTPKNPMLIAIKEEITVTAEADSIIDISLPSHRTILPSSIISELGTANIAEAVEKTPGVAMVGKGGYSMAPSIRGLAENRILLLVDGIRLTSERRIGASGSFINVNDIDRIEINRGPYSVFHGSGAIGGIINIITRSPSMDKPFQANLRLGYNTGRKERAASLNLSGSKGKYGFLVGINGKKADDYSSPSGKIEQSFYSDYDFLVKLIRKGENSQFNLTLFNYQGIDIGKPSPTSKLKPRWYPKERNTLFSVGYTLENRLSLDSLNANFYIILPSLETQKENLRESLEVKKRNLAKIDGINFGFKLRGGKTVGHKHALNFGLDVFSRANINDSNTEWQFDTSGNITKQINETSLIDARRNNFGLYINDKIQMSPSFTLSLGARFDYINTSNITDLGKRIKKSDTSFTAYIGSVFQVNSHLSLLANIGRSFRFPTISELFYSGLTGRGIVFGNPDLSPESSLNLDLGFRYFHDKYFVSIYGFSNSVSDMIQKYGGEKEEEFYYRNLTQGRIYGFEGEFYLWVIKDFEFLANFHHLVGKEKNTDAPLNYIPPSRLLMSVKFSPSRFWIEPKITFAAAINDPGPLEIEINGYTLFDIVFGLKLNPDISLIATALNLLNQTYRLSADESGVDAPGRSFVFRASYSF
ncbi:TonB-dependent receptor [Acidobacteriota bacterium]